MIVIILEYY